MNSRMLFHPNLLNRRFANFFFIVIVCFLLVSHLSAWAGEGVFKLTSIRGRVEVQSGGKGQWSAIRPGAREAAKGDHIRTGEHGSVYIVTDDGARVALGPKTEVALREPARPKGWRIIVGKVKTWFVGSHRLEVGAPGAIAAAEGTTFQLDVADDGASVLTVVEGTVQFYNELGSVKVLGSQQSTARVGQAPSRPIVVDPSSLTAWEVDLQTMIIPCEYPLVGTDSELLARELTRRQGLVEKHPQDATAHSDLAEVLLDLNRTEEAVAHAQLATELAPDQKRHHGILGFALIQAGRPEDAVQEFDKAAGDQLNWARWQIGLALAALGRGDAKAAVEILTEAATEAPNDSFIQAYIGAANLRIGDMDLARAAISRALELDPSNYVANAYLAYVKLAQGQVDDAVLEAREAVNLAPGSSLAHEALGNALTFAGKSVAARRELDQSIELDPLSPGAHLARAKLIATAGEIEEALQEAQVSVSLDPKSAPARSTLGLLYLLNNDPERAGHQFQAALTSDPSLSDARTGWGQVLLERGRFREAIEQQKLAVSTDTDSASAQNNLGGVYASVGQLDLAQEHLNSAINLQPGWGMPYANLALVFLEQNRFSEALEAGQRSVALGERSAFAHTVLARIYTRQERMDRALSELREAVALDDMYPQAHFQLAKLYLDQDRSRDAVREVLYSVVSDPSAMLETRSYARTENTLAGGSQNQIHYDVVHSGQANDGRLSYSASGFLDNNDGFRSINQDTRERFTEVIVGHQSRPTQQIVFFGTVYGRNGGLPGAVMADSAGDPDDRQDYSGFEGVLAYRQRLSPRVTGTLKYSLRRSDFDFSNPDSMAVADTNPFLELTNRNEQQSPEVRLDAGMGPRSSLSMGYSRLSDSPRQAGVIWTFDAVTGTLVPVSYAQSGTSVANTGWLEVKTSPNDRFHLTLGGYWGCETATSGMLLPKVVALYRPSKSDWWSFVASPLFHADVSELSPVEALADPKGLSFLDFA
jgi:Flp pilus assembly protein TadD